MRSRTRSRPIARSPRAARGWAAAVTYFLIATLGSAETNGSVEDAAGQIKGSTIAGHVRILASDEFEGRAPGTRGEALTLTYVEKQFRSVGLKPGAGASYRQPVPFIESKLTAEPRLIVYPAAQSQMNTPAPISFMNKKDFVAQLGRPLTRIAIHGASLVFAGFGATAPEFGWDDYAGTDVRGKIVVLLRGDPGTATGDAALFGGRNATRHSVTSEKIRNAAAHGARGVIIIHDDSAGYPWAVLSEGGLGHSQFFLKPEKAEPELDAVYFMSEAAGRTLLKAGGLDLDRLRKAATIRGFEAAAVADVRASIALRASIQPILSHNLVAVVPGGSDNRQCVYLLAHWDHMGRDPSLKGDQIFNGAVDNATGVGALIEIGRALKALHESPRRTIVLVATTAEERGLLGSEYLARHPVCPLRQTTAAVAIDALFPYGPDTHMTVTGYGNSELEDLLSVSAARYGRKLQDDGQPEAGANYRADHYPFLRRGIPGFLAVGGPGNDAAETNPQVIAMTDYVLHKYHRPTDEYEADTWDMRGIEGDARILFDFAWRTANDPRSPNWYWRSPLRPLRDTMLSQP
jgi:Zn-dependent M28 family amino/carboxypeptidase